jgi:hypothetical protein
MMAGTVVREWDQIVIGAGSSALNFLFAASQSTNKQFASQKILVIGEDDLWRGAHRGAAPPGEFKIDALSGALVLPPSSGAEKKDAPRGPEAKAEVKGDPPSSRAAARLAQVLGHLPKAEVKGDPRGFEMGQPEHLLYPLHMSHKPEGNVNFLVTSRYNQALSELKGMMQDSGVIFLRDKVKPITGVSRGGNGFIVSTVSSGTYTARQVIIASGAGPNQELGKMDVTVHNQDLLKKPRGYPEIVSGEEYVKWHPNKEGSRVLVYGGEPTAAWAAAHAIYSRPSLLVWMARSGFDGANPAGRNSAVVLEASERNSMWIGTVSRIEVLDKAEGPRLLVTIEPSSRKSSPEVKTELPKVPLRTEGDSAFNVTGQVLAVRFKESCEFDQFVYATGADALGDYGPINILDSSLRGELVPAYDRDGRFKPDERALVAFKTTREDLWIVGASVFRTVKFFDKTFGTQFEKEYMTIPEMFCEAGRPPEGVAVVKALIKAVTGYYEPGRGRFNWNTADRKELSEYLQATYRDLSRDQCDRIADVVIKKQSAKRVPGADLEVKYPAGHYPAFGMTEAEFQNCVANEIQKLRQGALNAAPPNREKKQ